MLVLGVDPGSQVTGYGLVEKKENEIACVHCGQISLPDKTPLYERIHRIFHNILDLMGEYRPQELAIEDIFYAKNVKSSLKLGHARGAVLIAAVQRGVQIFEYTPLQIKQSVTGYGRADKKQLRFMVGKILNLKFLPGLDTSDALAAAICHLNWTKYETRQG